MNRTIDSLSDITMLVIWLVFGIVSVSASLMSVRSNIHSYMAEDKITLAAMGEDAAPQRVEYTARDVILMCIVSDEYQPKPARMQVNTGAGSTWDMVVSTKSEQNESFYNRKGVSEERLNIIWNEVIKPIEDKKVKDISLVYDAGGNNLRWKITTE